MSSYLDITPELLELLGKVHCYFCGAEVWINYSEMDYASEDSKPIIRNVGDLMSYHSCAAGSAIKGR
jgi:hypothetical protein